MSELSDRYNKIFSENKITYGGGKPEQIVENILNYRSSGSVLELGAGEGRNALFLAEHGFEVTAHDISEVGIEKIQKAAEARNLHIQTEVVDDCTLQLDQNFDVFVCTLMLHHVRRVDVLKLIRQLQDHTTTEGINAITTFTKTSDFYEKDPTTNNFYPDKDELKELYTGWDILEYEEIQTEARATKPDGSPMRNVTGKLLARKPKNL